MNDYRPVIATEEECLQMEAEVTARKLRLEAYLQSLFTEEPIQPSPGASEEEN